MGEFLLIFFFLQIFEGFGDKEIRIFRISRVALVLYITRRFKYQRIINWKAMSLNPIINIVIHVLDSIQIKSAQYLPYLLLYLSAEIIGMILGFFFVTKIYEPLLFKFKNWFMNYK